MTIGKLVDGIVFIPSISLLWYVHNDKTHYYLRFAWLFWYIATMKKFKWEEDQ